ncbi:MAG: lysophospholipid acyltransferase family protein [Alphaproteobacteria bacterium]
MLENLPANARAVRRIAVGLAILPLFLTAAAVQGFLVGPLTGNYKTIPNMMYNTVRKILGFKVEFNAASAPVVKDKPAWYVANHLAGADFLVLGSALNGTFVGKDDITDRPFVAKLARAFKFIGVRRKKEFNPQSRGKIISNFNSGFNTIMFPEGTANDGKKLSLFHAGLLTLLYGEKGVDKKGRQVALGKDVVVQPVALRVKSVSGEDAAGRDDLRACYSMWDNTRPLSRIWARLKIRNITLELTAFPPLEPAKFSDAKELINDAALKIASVTNPGQTTFEKVVLR